jgi:GT2 family glycosyltransferase
VTVVIPHFSGKEILRHCLESLDKTEYSDYEVLIADNGSTDGSREMIQAEFPEVRIVESKTNLGFAGGCNLGIRASRSPYIVLLNNDTEVTPGWLGRIVETADMDDSVAAVQPKILSFHDRRRFDYCGAAGGELDLFGYPFAWGRLFDSMEIDTGQYDVRRQVFWATGAAVLLRRSALDRVGLLDEAFFAHMEEIDLNWRFNLAGYKVVFEPEAVVYHQTGGTLGQDRFRKMVLNHRNSLLMILRNHTASTLMWVLPLRILLEGITVVMAAMIGQPKRAVAVLWGLWGVLTHWKTVSDGRRSIRRFRSIPESMMLHRLYRGSVALAYYLGRIRKAQDLRSKRRLRSGIM